MTSRPVIPSMKGRYPFAVGTTSFIYPAGYCENVRLLAKSFDQIELLFFEKPADGKPEPDLVRRLARLAGQMDLDYNLHLPLDLELAHGSKQQRLAETDLASRMVSAFRELPVYSFTLHVNCHLPHDSPESRIAKWRRRAAESLQRLLAVTGIAARRISIENLAYPFQWIEPVISDLDLGVCLDIGHLAATGHDLKPALDTFGPMATIVHLYGTCPGRDHGSLDLLPADMLQQTARFLESYTGAVMLEVFNLGNLLASIATLQGLVKRRQDGCSRNGTYV